MAQIGLSQQELESRLWAAANSLRGPVDPSDFKAYIFPLLFYKRVNDNWDAERARAVADFEDDLTDEIEADYHRFVIPPGCRWIDLRRIAENIGVALQNILDRIQQANPETLAGIFGDVPWGNKDKLPETALLALIESFGTLNLSPEAVGHDVLGNAYEYCQWPISSTRWWPAKVPALHAFITSFLTKTDLLSLGPLSSGTTRRS